MHCGAEEKIQVNWQPIETAPKDASRVLVSWGNPAEDATFCRWFLNRRTGTEFWNDEIELDHYENETNPPKYWLPLPGIAP